jgi:hypothetical protein
MVALVGLAGGADAVTAVTRSGTVTGCWHRLPPTANAASLGRVLASGRDVLGEQLLAKPGGPSLAGVRRLLPSLFYARGRGGRSVTHSGAYYLAFAMPPSLYGDKAFALHVADGSEIMTRRAGGRNLQIQVGETRERYGRCLARLSPAHLASGYLPILRTEYVDGDDAHYQQESFAGRVPGNRSLISFVRLSVDARSATRGAATVRFIPSTSGLTAIGHQLKSVDGTRLIFSAGGVFDGTALTYQVHGRETIVVGWVHQPTRTPGPTADEETYASARAGVVRFWNAALARETVFSVPDRSVENAMRNVLTQQIVHTWRYSIGNNYEELSFAEALDSAQVMAAYGFGDVARAIVRFALRRLPDRYTNWRAGEALLAAAVVSDLGSDEQLLAEATPALDAAIDRLAHQINRPGSTGLLNAEPFSSDIQRKVVTLHGQAVVWQGLRAIAREWQEAGHNAAAARATRMALRLEVALRAAIKVSARRLPDGSLFVPAELLAGAEPFERISATREGSYWNLVAPYAFASGLFRPGGGDAQRIVRYLLGHGSRLIGLVRAGAYRLYGEASAKSSGTDQVYGLNVSRFLADNNRPDQLVLSLYGTLGAAMTPNTFVSGEAATVAPIGPTSYRTMYLPPNSGTNATFLGTLRLTLVHETRGPRGTPTGLELAFATPRSWLAPGKTISVQNAPTSFGTLSYVLTRSANRIRVSVDPVPSPALKLRLRLPLGERVAAVRSAGSVVPFDRRTGTIDLSRRKGHIELTVVVAGSES